MHNPKKAFTKIHDVNSM